MSETETSLAAKFDDAFDEGRFVEAFLAAMTTDETGLLQALMDGESVAVHASDCREPWFRDGELSVTWGHLLQLGYLRRWQRALKRQRKQEWTQPRSAPAYGVSRTAQRGCGRCTKGAVPTGRGWSAHDGHRDSRG